AVVDTIEHTTAAPELHPYLRLVHDRLLLVDEQVAAQLELLSTVLQVSMAVSSLRQADISLRQADIAAELTKVGLHQDRTIQRLTTLATIFLPLTFISGFFGQVFAWQAGHWPTYSEFIVYGLAVVGVLVWALVWWLRRASARRAGTRAGAGR